MTFQPEPEYDQVKSLLCLSHQTTDQFIDKLCFGAYEVQISFQIYSPSIKICY